MREFKVGIELVPNIPIQEVIELAEFAEKSKFNYVWITDHYNNRNVYATLTAIALRTSRVFLGPGVTNPYVVNPAWTASAIASIHELSKGRAVLGIGPGDRMTLAPLKISIEKPIAALREAVSAIRSLLKGESLTFEGKVCSFKGARLSYKPEGKIPIYIGAQGPSMLRLAGEIGDGVLINASHPEDFKFAIEKIKEGVEKAGRKLEEIDIAAYTCFSISLDREKAKKSARPVVAFITAGCPETVLERHGIPTEEGEKIRKLIERGDFKGAFTSVTDQMLESFSIYGTPSDCAERLHELLRIGVTQLVIGSPIGPDKKEAIKLVSEEVIPKLA